MKPRQEGKQVDMGKAVAACLARVPLRSSLRPKVCLSRCRLLTYTLDLLDSRDLKCLAVGLDF